MEFTEEQERQAERLASDLFARKIAAKHLDMTVAVMMANDVISMCLGAMCPGCRDAHWRMLEQHFPSIRERAEIFYQNAYPDKPPTCTIHPVQ